ncbi:FAD-binding oxidoreductase [Ktedonobacter robiniae]|uniref:FAD-binding oxidoreductase n=1 Tax=Ktedonobacter robiniae TaxID=2778365 RepID=UPI00191680EC|nr:FAD-binding oxidoreductase [Ktedonobacter robiniae]
MKPTRFDALANAPTSRRKVLQTLAVLAGTSCLEGLQIAGLDDSALAVLRDGEPGEWATGGTKLTGRLVFPNSPNYNSARLGWARQFSQFPLVIVFCQNAQDVVNALSWCREHNVAFRARSGRHCLEGWSALDGGVVIDVSNMNQIHVDTSAEVATVQTGATQGAVVTALGKIGYAIPSGGEKTPGIGGVTLGGGIGTLARSMGLACDHLIGLEMVVPSGKQGAEVIQVDEHNHADLLWACRGGGGGNFGIATSFTFKIRPISTVTIYDATWGSADWQHVSELLSVWQSLTPSADDRLGSTFNSNSKKNGSIASNGIFIGSQEAQLRQLLQPLLGIGTPKVTIQTMSYLDAWLHFAAPPDPPHNDKFSSVWVYSALPPKAIETVHSFLANAPTPQANIWCLSWGGAVGRIPTEATAFFHRKAQFYMEWDSPWTNDTEEGQAIAWVEQFREALQPYVNGSYINVPDRSINDLRTYYGNNLARLQEVKRMYDPENVFHFEQSIPPN